MNEESTVLPDAREGSPTAPRGAPEAWWASAAPRPFGGSQSGGGLPPREADREGQNFFWGAASQICLGRGREVRRCPVPRLPRLACPIQRAAAGASAHSPRAARAAPRTAPTPAPTPLACAHHRTRRCRPSPGPRSATNTPIARRRPTPPAPVPVGGWAAGGRVTSGCARESVGLRRCALLGGAAGGGAVEACASSMRRARADR